MKFITKNTKENANTKATKEYIFGAPCLPAGRFVITGISFLQF
jgi:hypothetical protein